MRLFFCSGGNNDTNEKSDGGIYMFQTIDFIVNAVKQHQIIHIKYDSKHKEEGKYKILPLHFFTYNGIYYLTCKSISNNQYLTLKVENIYGVETTFLLGKDDVPLETIAMKKGYNLDYVFPVDVYKEEDVAHIHSYYGNHAKSTGKIQHENLFQYYIEALRIDDMKKISFKLEDEHFYVIDKENCIPLFQQFEAITRLPSAFEEFFAKVKHAKNTSLFLGYPQLSNGKGTYYPFLYAEIVVSEEEAIIQLKRSRIYINKRFASDACEISLADALEVTAALTSKDMSSSSLSENVRRNLKRYNILDKGVIFLNKSSNANYKTVEELKQYARMSTDFFTPMKKFIEPTFPIDPKRKDAYVMSPVLINYSQRETVTHVNNDILLCQGPPGTGKTQTIVNIIANEVLKGNTVLVASTNNKAVDNVKEKLNGDKTLYTGTLRLGDENLRTKAIQQVKQALDEAKADTTPYTVNKEELLKKSDEMDKSLKELLKQLHLIRNIEKQISSLYKAIDYTEELILDSDIKQNPYSILDKYSRLHKEETPLVNILHALNQVTFHIENKRNHPRMQFSFFKWIYKAFELNRQRKIIGKLGLTLDGLKQKKSFEAFLDALEQYKVVLQLLILLKEKDVMESQKKGIKNYEEDDIKVFIQSNLEEKLNNDVLLLKQLDHERIENFTEPNRKQLMGILNDEKVYYDSVNDFSLLTQLYPIILCTNQSVPTCIPINYAFDLVIIDEASQCNLPASLPAIKRAKRLLVVGDDEQLKPVTELPIEWDELLLEENRVSMDDKKNSIYKFSANSLFDFYRNVLDDQCQFFLNEHFRCHFDIIQFSNQEFYNNDLIVSTSPTKSKLQGILGLDISTKEIPLSLPEIGNINPYEVKAIIDFIEEKFEYIRGKSIGITTPFKDQCRHIIEQINKRREDETINPEIKKLYDQLIENVAIGSVHTFQGGEKQIIFFSTVVSFGMDKPLDKWLNKEKNLINVGNTRAIEALVVVGDFQFLQSAGGILKKLSLYVENVAQNVEKPKINPVFSIVHPIIYKKMSNEHLRRLLNSSEEKMYHIMKRLLENKFQKYDIYPKIRVADVIKVEKSITGEKQFYYALSAHFDFIIFNKQTYMPVAAFEFDGPEHDKPEQRSKDDLKDELCKKNDFPISRFDYRSELTDTSLLENMEKVLLNCSR